MISAIASNKSQTITLKAGQSGAVQHVTGSEFLCVTATGVFQMSFDGSNYFDMQGGISFSQPYTSLWFTNNTGADIVLEFYYGTLKLSMNVLNFVAGAAAVPVSAVLSSPVASASEALGNQFVKVPAINTVTALSAGQLFVSWVLLIAKQGFAGALNAGAVGVGWSNAANAQPLVMNPGDQWVIPVRVGGKVDLAKLFMVTANAGDGLVVMYIQ